MDRFMTRQPTSRTRGAALSAPGDGLAQGTPYTAVIQSNPSGGFVQVTIPALGSLVQTYKARISPEANAAPGEVALVIFDEGKIPWVVVGEWASALAAKIATLEGEVTTLTSEATTLITEVAALEGEFTALTYTAPSLEHSWVNFGEGYEPAGYCKDAFGFVHIRGVVKSGVTAKAIFTLPAGFRPSVNILYPAVSSSAFAGIEIVGGTGEVVPGAYTSYISLDTVFLAEA